MNYPGNNDWRGRRNHLNQHLHGTMPNFGAFNFSYATYSTDAQQSKRTEMRNNFEEEVIVNKLCMMPNPLQKNLADTIIVGDEKKKHPKMATQTKEYPYFNENPQTDPRDKGNNDSSPTLGGISSIISGLFNVISGVVFHKRAKSPAPQYFDCFDGREGSPALEFWQPSKNEVATKNERAGQQFGDTVDPNTADAPLDMNTDTRTAVAQCEQKLNRVRQLLKTKNVQISPKLRPRRPKKMFVEPGSVEENFVDAFSPEDFDRLSNDTTISYTSPYNVQNQETTETCSPKATIEKMDLVCDIKKNCNLQEDTEVYKGLNNVQNQVTTETLPDDNIETISVDEKVELVSDIKESSDRKEDTEVLPCVDKNPTEQQIKLLSPSQEARVSSCEDKLNKLKALMQSKCKNTRMTVDSSDSPVEPYNEKVDNRPKNASKALKIPSTPKMLSNRFKNPNRQSVDKRTKSRLKQNVQDDMCFGAEIDTEDLSSVENSPSIKNSLPESPSSTEKSEDDYFNEVTGRFRSTSTSESEESFQIVFADSPRSRKPSESGSEDSFIVFEDECYTTTDVFGNEPSDSETEGDSDSETDSDTDDDASANPKISHSLTRTMSDLTDNSLYEDGDIKCEDVVDCAFPTVREISCSDIKDISDRLQNDNSRTGLLLDEDRKNQNKKLTSKKVHFSSEPPKVHVMRVWAFAARQARAGHWERHALDRERFKRRIADVEMAISWVLKRQHRQEVMFHRFMPWWNAQERLKIAEKKQKEDEDRLKREEEIKKDAEANKEVETNRDSKGEADIFDKCDNSDECNKIINRNDIEKDLDNNTTVVDAATTGVNNDSDKQTNDRAEIVNKDRRDLDKSKLVNDGAVDNCGNVTTGNGNSDTTNVNENRKDLDNNKLVDRDGNITTDYSYTSDKTTIGNNDKIINEDIDANKLDDSNNKIDNYDNVTTDDHKTKNNIIHIKTKSEDVTQNEKCTKRNNEKHNNIKLIQPSKDMSITDTLDELGNKMAELNIRDDLVST